MTPPPCPNLEEKIQREIEEILGEVHISGCQISQGRIQAVLQVIELAKHRKQAAPPRNWLPGALWVITAFIVSILILVPVWWEQEIEVEVVTSSVGFLTLRDQPLWRPPELHSLRASPLKQVQFESNRLPPCSPISPDGWALDLTTDGIQGEIVFLRQAMDRNNYVFLQAQQKWGSPYSFTMTVVQRQFFPFHAVVRGPATIRTDSTDPLCTPSKTITDGETLSMEMNSFAGRVSFDMELRRGAKSAPNNESITGNIFYEVPVAQLSFYEQISFEESNRKGHFGSIGLSSIQAGYWSNLSLGATKKVLYPSDTLRFESFYGVIRSMELTESAIKLHAYGHATGIQMGATGQVTSQMPSLLQWIKSSAPWELFFATTTYLLGLLVALQKWWKRQ